MPKRRSNEDLDFGSRSPSPCGYEYTEKPVCTEEDLKHIAACQESRIWDLQSIRPYNTKSSEEETRGNTGKRPRLGREHSPLLDPDAKRRPYPRKRAKPAARGKPHKPENTIGLRSTASDRSKKPPTSESSETAATRPLQPILKPSDNQTGAPKPNRRVSFSTEDQVVVFEQEDETPIKDASNQWKINRLPRRKDWEEEMADLSIDIPNPYEQYNSPNRYPHAQGKQGLQERDQHKFQESEGSGQASESSLKELGSQKSPDKQLKKPSHRHIYVNTNCGHEITDPMSCYCEDPDKVYESKLSNCQECRERRLEEERIEKAAPNKDGKPSNQGTWWNKLKKKKN
ncbi:hypothetical protein TWF718_001975 [Orbilia javanica]|uniref:Uncharacterized protein n=1 Tax=Orbilia javanica TaxID=47235 RepID=A0AAN8MZQ3_9PEZI